MIPTPQTPSLQDRITESLRGTDRSPWIPVLQQLLVNIEPLLEWLSPEEIDTLKEEMSSLALNATSAVPSHHTAFSLWLADQQLIRRRFRAGALSLSAFDDLSGLARHAGHIETYLDVLTPKRRLAHELLGWMYALLGTDGTS